MKKSIVIFRSAALGDFILSTPALKIVREQFPHHIIKFITISTTQKSQAKLVAKYVGGCASAPWLSLATPHLIDESFVFDQINLSNFLKCKKWLKKSNIDFVILMLDPCAPYMGRIKKIIFLKLLSNFKKIYGWKGRGSLSQNNTNLLNNNLIKHHVYGPLQFLSEISSFKNFNPPIEFDLRPNIDSLKSANNIISSLATGDLKIGVFPGAIHKHKKWPTINYISLINRLQSDYKNITFVFFGTKNDVDFFKDLDSSFDFKIINLIGKASIDQTAAVLPFMDLVIGNDGGGIHLAAAMGCKVISIIPGIEYPGAIDPWNNYQYSVRHEVNCSPCYSFSSCPNGTSECMYKLPVDRVYQMCKSVLNIL